MSDLSRLDSRIQQLLGEAEAKRDQHQEHIRRRMHEVEERMARFTQIAARLVREIIQPRMQILAGHFNNARLDKSDTSGRHLCSCGFEHTPHFPASVQLRFGVSPDDKVDNLIVFCRLEILPIFIEFQGSDQVLLPIEQVDEALIGDWINKKIDEFVRVYLRLESAKEYQAENMVADPVCGMALNKNWAAARMEHEGRTYYFCLEECQRKFAEDPQRYLSRGTAPG